MVGVEEGGQIADSRPQAGGEERGGAGLGGGRGSRAG